MIGGEAGGKVMACIDAQTLYTEHVRLPASTLEPHTHQRDTCLDYKVVEDVRMTQRDANGKTETKAWTAMPSPNEPFVTGSASAKAAAARAT